jgi:hypothetical protein
MYDIMQSANSDNMTFSFPVCMPYIAFSCQIFTGSTSSTRLNKSGGRKHLLLVPDLRENSSSFSLFSVVLPIAAVYIPSLPSILRIFIT